MSLSFVKSSLLTSKDGTDYVETSIESSELSALRSRSSTYVKPLFDQLSDNKNLAQEEYDAITASLRGTRTLDEGDVAHLAGIEQKRANRERMIARAEEDDVRMFHALQMERTVGHAAIAEDKTGKICCKDEEEKRVKSVTRPSNTMTKVVPIVVKKKRKRLGACESVQKETKEAFFEEKEEGSNPREDNQNRLAVQDIELFDPAGTSLVALLGCYGSDDDSD
eukprot:CAMPEP_0113307836 /NCGR_PEP_ID=MMETSP0010_2-20120614/6523_1 /TAXON_ID=216773 ORGANISM="Corethron hystrix, Strain 308" /NCGR_SAMPLE_ID=MMETSP0010_2 /ASSEMBLY_ACC=CAM_ASM_000155 /LENGTH=222 /DNA_ID=CAMNT_0000162773 /DNA_START=189 /DNA_END=857 /DNA_ORIENTATION=- /assembly_acc=CAM_ASM_000155